MDKVTQEEIVEALRNPYDWTDAMYTDLANRVEREGIAPPDGWVLVPLSDLENMRFQIDETVSKLIFEMLAAAPKPEDV